MALVCHQMLKRKQHFVMPKNMECRVMKILRFKDRNAIKFTLRKVRINQAGYDSNGSYWGLGSPLYWAHCDNTRDELMLRARDRAHAKEKVRETYPNATFYN
jgi:hypothetical protein